MKGVLKLVTLKDPNTVPTSQAEDVTTNVRIILTL